MNELENYYDQTEGFGNVLSQQQQNLEAERRGVMETKGQLDDITTALDEAKAEKIEREGAEATGGGLGTIATLEATKGMMKRVVKNRLQKAVQSKIDDIAQRKGQAPAPEEAPAEGDVYARNQPELDIDGMNSGDDVREASRNLRGRVANMDDETQENVMGSYRDDPERIDEPNTLDDYQNNLGLMEGHVKDAEGNPATTFTDENINKPAEAPAPEPEAPRPVEQAPQRAIQPDEEFGDLNEMPLQEPVRLNLQQVAPEPAPAEVAPRAIEQAPAQAQDAMEGVGDELKSVSQKGMDALEKNLGVDFGDLTPADIGTSLGGLVGEGTGDLLGTLGGVVGSALDYLGPAGMLAGVITTGVGLADTLKSEKDQEQKRDDIQKLADNINTTGGMSFGSIASAPLDTSQFRSGGEVGNF